MDRKTFLAMLAGGAAVVLAMFVIGDDATAAPIDSTQTVRATLAVATDISVQRTFLDDGGSDFLVSVFAVAPRTSEIADGGTRVDVVQLPKAQCPVRGAMKTALENFFEGGAIRCARVSADLEN